MEELRFVDRHIGPREEDISSMLQGFSAKNLDDFMRKSVPSEILNVKNLNLPHPLSEHQLIHHLRGLVQKNKVFKNYIGQGFFECLPLSVTNRHIIKNPVWYTAYTPYQSELAQGRLEALLNYQTLISDLTGMDLANASLLDEGSAAAESVIMALRIHETEKKTVFVDDNIWPQTFSVLETRMNSLGIKIQKGSFLKDEPSEDVFAVFFQYPFGDGSLVDMKDRVQKWKKKNILILVSSDLLASCLLQPPGEWRADVVVGSAGRIGLPLFYGGPHAAFLATRKEFASHIPGRIVGVSKDRHGHSALRLALQTREQHIRRERATSNICTSQVLPAVLVSMYAVYHGPEGLRKIAKGVHEQTCYLYCHLAKMGFSIFPYFFDTLSLSLKKEQKDKIKILTEAQGINLGYNKNVVNISVGEGQKDMDELIKLFQKISSSSSPVAVSQEYGLPASLIRKSSYLTHEVFHKYHSETNLVRYIYSLQNKDLTLTHSMIPLGSCTMKLNAVTELQSMTWKGFSDIHPFCPHEQVSGSLEIFKELEDFLCEITGFKTFCLQPNAGSQGEYAGLMTFRRYHESIGEGSRHICLIPSSAHGTNPASARVAGLQIVTVNCDNDGSINIKDLKKKLQEHSRYLSSLMLTYPSTCGIFEEDVSQICQTVHEHGGLVYFDGANMNALTGLCQPALLGMDAGHLNLHKTFCIPHGGGGPGAGPIGVVEKLKPFLPSHFFWNEESKLNLSSSPFGNAGVLSIPWAYIRMMGFEGLKKASQVAILNANYMKKRLESHYRILFKGKNDCVAHECIIDLRKFKYSAGITVTDVAKRLMDYGFHAPTVNWPVAGTMMIEPTESEDKEELDRFCDALISIRKEIQDIEDKKSNVKSNVLKNAPHTLQDLIMEEWPFPYTKKQACYPLSYLNQKKFWPSVSRVEEAFGDINLFCSCTSSDPSILE